MKHRVRYALILMLVGCALDEAWEDEVALENTQEGVSGELFTFKAQEGKSVGCTLRDANRYVHASFVGVGRTDVLIVTESLDEREFLFVDVYCDVDQDGVPETDGGDFRRLSFGLEPDQTEHQFVLPAEVLECGPSM